MKGIKKMKNGYGLDVWGNYLEIKTKNNLVESIKIIRDEKAIEKAKEALKINH